MLPDITENTDVVLVSLITFLVTYYLYNYGLYWWFKQVPGPVPLPFIGNSLSRWMGTMSLVDCDDLYYSDYGGKRYCGFYEFDQKTIMIGDLHILRHILTKDLGNFDNRSNMVQDEKWNKVRSLLIAPFSAEKMKDKILSMPNATDKIEKRIFRNNQKEVDDDVSIFLGQFLSDVLAMIAFGADLKELSPHQSKMKTNDQEPGWQKFVSRLLSVFRSQVEANESVLGHNSKSGVFEEIIKETLRKEDKNVNNNNFVDIFKQIKPEKNKRNKTLTEDLLLSQRTSFFMSLMDTTSTTLSFVLHNLAFNEYIQDKVLREIDSTIELKGSCATYETLCQMKYLDLTLKETERMYPTVTRTTRMCKKKYHLPDTNVTLEAGTEVVIPIRCINLDPEHFRDPHSFNPERFCEEKNSKTNPMSFLPSGQGHRIYIGNHISNLEMKMCIVNFLRRFRVSPCSKSERQIRFDNQSQELKPSKGVWLKIIKRN